MITDVVLNQLELAKINNHKQKPTNINNSWSKRHICAIPQSQLYSSKRYIQHANSPD